MNDLGTLFGRPIGQSSDDLLIWEKVLNEFDHFKWIVEFGSWEGAMSLYLFVQCWSRDLLFYTFDKKHPEQETPYFINADVLKDNVWPMLSKIKSEPGILFCDDGNKPEEVKKYHKIIHRDSFIAVHDYLTEFKNKDIPDTHRWLYHGGSTVFLAQHNFINQYLAKKAMEERR